MPTPVEDAIGVGHFLPQAQRFALKLGLTDGKEEHCKTLTRPCRIYRMTTSRLSFTQSFLRARFSADGYLGLHLTVGAAALLVAALVFANLAEDVVTSDSMVAIDLRISSWFYAHTSPVLTKFFLIITWLHSTLGVIALGLLFAAFLAKARAWSWALLLLVSVPPGMLLNVLLKHIFQRARPSFEQPLLSLATYSFPSGHTAGAALLYGVACGYVLSFTHGWWRVLVIFAALLMVALVGLSRIYLGVHYLSDVLAAVASSTVWLAFTFTAVTTWRKRKSWLIALSMKTTP